MKLNNIHQELNTLYKNKGKFENLLSFEFTCEDEVKRVIKNFRSGYWSVMPFAFDTYSNFGIKLHPKNRIENSSIVDVDNSDGVTVAANLKTFLPLINLRYLKKIKIIEKHFIEKRKDITEISLAYREYTNGLDSLDFFYNYITDSESLKLFEGSDKNLNQVYLDFWNYYNNTPEQKVYSDLIIKLVSDREFYPEFKEVDYGIWNHRMHHALAHRVYGNLDVNFNKAEKYYWNNLIQSHGFDGLKQDFGLRPNPSSNSYLSLRPIYGAFDTNLSRTFSKEVLEHPLYEAVQELRINQRGYKGEKHIEAAAILDTEYNDPYAAWDALVTASYWAGQAGSRAIEPMWEAAIYLSEKHNWTEINEVLVQQYEYYNYYKDKI